ncbi:MAG: hypothetical protein ACRCUJ_12855 [Phocaeicola sp.]
MNMLIDDLDLNFRFTVGCRGSEFMLTEHPEKIKGDNLPCKNLKTGEVILLSRFIEVTSHEEVPEPETFLKNTQYGMAAVIGLLDGRWKVTFLSTNFRCIVSDSQLESGELIDYMVPRMYGVGFGEYYQSEWKNFDEYKRVWLEILNTCYEKCEATMDPRWHDFRIFRREFKRIGFSKPFLEQRKGTLTPAGSHFSRETLKIWL